MTCEHMQPGVVCIANLKLGCKRPGHCFYVNLLKMLKENVMNGLRISSNSKASICTASIDAK